MLFSPADLKLSYVPSQDEKYWSRRCKNNEAAKRSRDARRLKENQISVRAAYLERENATLRQEVAEMRKELGRCRNILSKYENHLADQWWWWTEEEEEEEEDQGGPREREEEEEEERI